MRLVTLFLAGVLAAFIISCENEESGIEDGSYVGSYTRGDSVSYITLNFANFRYEGSSSIPVFPGICRGTVAWDVDYIYFGDECEGKWIKVEDYTLILDGRYTYTWEKGKLTFWRGTGDFYERYTVEKLEDKTEVEK
jgi:hypothetical protein